jgi:hypothetical protein
VSFWCCIMLQGMHFDVLLGLPFCLQHSTLAFCWRWVQDVFLVLFACILRSCWGLQSRLQRSTLAFCWGCVQGVALVLHSCTVGSCWGLACCLQRSTLA